MGIEGFGADFMFFLGDDDEASFIYGLVNLALFLANVMVESIKTDSCDEPNWQHVSGRYAISNSCGQDGRSYGDEGCEEYSCPVDPLMEITAATSDNQDRAPPPLHCKPGSGDGYYSGYYSSQTAMEITNTPYSNTAGRTDVEGCCWWGRGALLTRGTCNIGKLNYYIGKRAADEGRPSLYPDIDFCTNPEATCSSSSPESLRWKTAMLEWSERVQRYTNENWVYLTKLEYFVDAGMVDDSFVKMVCRILANAWNEAGSTQIRMEDERVENFYMIANNIFDIQSLIAKKTQQPSMTSNGIQPLLPVIYTPVVKLPAPTYSPIAPPSIMFEPTVPAPWMQTNDVPLPTPLPVSVGNDDATTETPTNYPGFIIGLDGNASTRMPVYSGVWLLVAAVVSAALL
ncbi:predicted protein [Thalassiosira pseudonana CCMP1335]|uniref:Uncharacterized protein n=1 Tax=Thalassiosira pseudonana TaxID=35128 RepID=B8C619_THAPS|nr:predicted protein [Thalassiosira pseudonana CCMP1335]EED91216.1 predicted protein [Thalassiosira pseudonana CCMP1335]